MTTTRIQGWAVIVALALGAGVVRADWNLGEPYKMHWPQLPDLTPLGMDVNATLPNVLADDFLCTESGPITNIHIWASWFADQVDLGAIITLSIHTDIPTNQTQTYSMPGPTIWWRAYVPGEYTIHIWTNGIQEGWLNPPTNYIPPPADTMCLQYNFPVDTGAVVQVSNTIYWLNVQVLSQQGLFGWKTTEPQWHWNDDATWAVGAEPLVAGWTNLVYPPGHPLAPRTLDLAFVIDGGYPPAAPRCPKWEQEPDCAIGIDIESWRIQDLTPGPRVADDWLCDGRPITAIGWWGSYLGWETTNGAPLPPPTNFPFRPVGFVLTWYEDVAASPTNFSHPGSIILSNVYPLAAYESVAPGSVYETTACVSALSFAGSNLFEHEYFYFIELTNDWNEKEGRVYWLSVEAVYLNPPPSNRWGWKTTSPDSGWNDAAVRDGGGGWTNMIYPPAGWTAYTNHPYKGRPVDLAFRLFTDICPARCKKWAQPPDMRTGQDMPSWTRPASVGVLRAGNFISDGRPITDIHWWGSYLDWQRFTPGPVPPPAAAPYQPTGFYLSWHLDDGTCRPGATLTNFFVSLADCHEVYFGSVTQYWEFFGAYEHEYQYYVDLLTAGSGLPWAETNGGHYWLDIQAVFPTNYVPDETHRGWGWKITPATNNLNCLSVVSTNGGTSWTNDTVGAASGPTHPRFSDNFDVSFELTTTNLPWTTNSIVMPRFTNLTVRPAVDSAYLWTTGHCGCGRQVLQASTNLRAGDPGWVGVRTNTLPRQQNLWIAPPLSTQRFYRVVVTN